MFLAIVQDAFQISGRGCVVVLTQPRSPEFRLRAKDRIQLRYPDGRILETYIAGIEMLCGPNVKKEGLAFLLPESITKSDVPSGTEVWLEANSN